MTDHSPTDTSKREFLRQLVTTLAGVGAVGALIPFIRFCEPNRQAIAAGAPVRVKVGQMKPGDQLTVVWRGRPVWIVRRTPEMIANLAKLTPELRDPTSKEIQQPLYAHNQYRAIKPEFFVVVGICTHLGCVPTYRPMAGAIQPDWLGGFYCTCHGSKFDLAGRVYKGVPAPLNLEVPPYHFVNDDEIVIGEGPAKT